MSSKTTKTTKKAPATDVDLDKLAAEIENESVEAAGDELEPEEQQSSRPDMYAGTVRIDAITNATTTQLAEQFDEAAEIASRCDPIIIGEMDNDSKATIMACLSAGDLLAATKFQGDVNDIRAQEPWLKPLMEAIQDAWRSGARPDAPNGKSVYADIRATLKWASARSYAFNAMQIASDNGQLQGMTVQAHSVLKKMRPNFVDSLTRYADAFGRGEDDPRPRFKVEKDPETNKFFIDLYIVEPGSAVQDIHTFKAKMAEVVQAGANYGSRENRRIQLDDIIEMMGLYLRDSDGTVIKSQQTVKDRITGDMVTRNLPEKLPHAACMSNTVYKIFYNERFANTGG